MCSVTDYIWNIWPLSLRQPRLSLSVYRAHDREIDALRSAIARTAPAPVFGCVFLASSKTASMSEAPPYSPRVEINGHFYFPEPYSLDPLPDDLRVGLIPVGVLAMLSVGATLTLISFIVWRLITWRMHYRTFIGYNQYVLLVLNLLIADLQQSSAFLISWHWIRFSSILAPSAPCFAQAWLLHSGDVSSGFFVLAIALHTFTTAVHGKRIGHKTFGVVVGCIWAFSYFLTGIGVGLHKYASPVLPNIHLTNIDRREEFFVRAGAWCWISEKYEDERLALHYICTALSSSSARIDRANAISQGFSWSSSEPSSYISSHFTCCDKRPRGSSQTQTLLETNPTSRPSKQ